MGAERLRLWIPPVVAVVTTIAAGFAAYYSAQTRIFQTVDEIGRQSKEMVADVRYEILGTTKDVQASVSQLDQTVQSLASTVSDLREKQDTFRDEMPKGVIPELRAQVQSNEKRLDKVEQDVIRLRAESEGRKRRTTP